MARNDTPGKRKRRPGARKGLDPLDAMIDMATVDCYGEDEALTGFYTLLEENLAVPFTTNLLGVEVSVERIDLTIPGGIVAVCRRGRERQRIPLLDLPLPDPRPEGADWIDAYRRWARGGRSL